MDEVGGRSKEPYGEYENGGGDMESCRVCCRENMLLSSVTGMDCSLAVDCLRVLNLLFDVLSVLVDVASMVIGLPLIFGERSYSSCKCSGDAELEAALRSRSSNRFFSFFPISG